MLFPSSRFATQARALEVEIRRDAGQPVDPAAAGDEQLRLMALQALQQSDPVRALPMLDNILRGPAPPRLKTRALFLVAQSDRPEARQLLADIAAGDGNPALRRRAIGYLAARDDAESLVALARKETNAAMKREIVEKLALMRNKVALDYLAELAR
jgi:hypothetical protein